MTDKYQANYARNGPAGRDPILPYPSREEEAVLSDVAEGAEYQAFWVGLLLTWLLSHVSGPWSVASGDYDAKQGCRKAGVVWRVRRERVDFVYTGALAILPCGGLLEPYLQSMLYNW